MHRALRFRWILLTATLALAACSGASNAGFAPTRSDALPRVALPLERLASDPSKGKIKHIIIIVQENRSFDNMFNGYPGADTAQVGTIHTGQVVPLQQVSLAQGYNIAQNAAMSLQQLGHTHNLHLFGDRVDPSGFPNVLKGKDPEGKSRSH